METLIRDLNYALRVLAKRPVFALVAILTLAVGIGANTAIFSVVNAVLLRQLPFKNPGKLVWVWSTRTDRDRAFFSIPDFLDYKERSQRVEELAAFANWGASLTGTAEAERFQGVRITSNAFQLLGVEAAAGRTLLPEDDKPGNERVLVISYGLWQRRFGGDPNLIGQSLALNDQKYTVVGVLPSSFIFPGAEAETEIAVPLSPGTDARRAERGSNFLRVFARLKPDAAIKQVQSEFATISSDLKQKYPDTNGKHTDPRVLLLQDEIVGSYKTALLVLLAAVGLVLLIACSNLASLLMARASARRKEMAVRTALGAGRTRLIRQLLTENMLLAAAGGILGILGAWWSIDLVLRLSPSDLPRAGEINIDTRVLAFTVAVSLLAGIVFGLAPAIQATRVDLIAVLKGGTTGSTGGASSNRTRSTLVVAEIAISLVLLIGAGLLVKSFQRLQSVSPGFNAQGLLLVRLSLPQSRYSKSEDCGTFYDNLVTRVGALPSVESIGLTNVVPLSATNVRTDFTIVGRAPASPTDVPAAQNRLVSSAYFHTMGITVLKGREFAEFDTSRSQPVAVIDKAMAEQYWPAENPIGSHLKIDDGGSAAARDAEIIGVVENVKNFGLDEEPTPTIYSPFSQMPEASLGFFLNRMNLVVRTSSEPLSLAQSVRSAVQSIDKDVPASSARSLDQFISASVAPRRFNLLLFGVFAGIALLLSVAGVYGVISYSVSQSTREIGIRMALGARPGDVLKGVLAQGMRLVVMGVSIGIVGAFALTRVISGLLYGVSATDPATFSGVSIMLAIVALGACFVPARRATKVDPMKAIRYE